MVYILNDAGQSRVISHPAYILSIYCDLKGYSLTVFNRFNTNNQKINYRYKLIRVDNIIKSFYFEDLKNCLTEIVKDYQFVKVFFNDNKVLQSILENSSLGCGRKGFYVIEFDPLKIENYMLSLHLIIGAGKLSIDSELAKSTNILEDCQNFNPINPSQKIYSLMLPFIEFEESYLCFTSV